MSSSRMRSAPSFSCCAVISAASAASVGPATVGGDGSFACPRDRLGRPRWAALLGRRAPRCAWGAGPGIRAAHGEDTAPDEQTADEQRDAGAAGPVRLGRRVWLAGLGELLDGLVLHLLRGLIEFVDHGRCAQKAPRRALWEPTRPGRGVVTVLVFCVPFKLRAKVSGRGPRADEVRIGDVLASNIMVLRWIRAADMSSRRRGWVRCKPRRMLRGPLDRGLRRPSRDAVDRQRIGR